MKAGDVVRWTFVQADGQRKMRPAILLTQVPPFKDWLVCAVSTQLQRQVNGLDVLINNAHPDFGRAGLRTDSLVRVAQLATLPERHSRKHRRYLTRHARLDQGAVAEVVGVKAAFCQRAGIPGSASEILRLGDIEERVSRKGLRPPGVEAHAAVAADVVG